MTTTSIDTAIEANIQKVEAKANRGPDFGNGRYSGVMEELHNDIVRLLPQHTNVAERIARQFGSDFGAAMRDLPVAIKLGKRVSDDGKLTLSESCKAKNITVTNAISVARAVNYMNDALKNGISPKHTQWRLEDGLEKYATEMATTNKK